MGLSPLLCGRQHFMIWYGTWVPVAVRLVSQLLYVFTLTSPHLDKSNKASLANQAFVFFPCVYCTEQLTAECNPTKTFTQSLHVFVTRLLSSINVAFLHNFFFTVDLLQRQIKWKTFRVSSVKTRYMRVCLVSIVQYKAVTAVTCSSRTTYLDKETPVSNQLHDVMQPCVPGLYKTYTRYFSL